MNVGFSPDRPIETASQDSLGRSSLAFLLAQKISEWRGRESLVIALYGPWGSGKSSVKNLILEKLREEKYKPFDPIEFNPWLPSGVEKITESFFYEIGVKLSLQSVLKNLFPNLKTVWDNWLYSGEALAEWNTGKRICTERFFDRYFFLEVPPGQVSEAVIKRILNTPANKTEILSIFNELGKTELIIDALERLESEHIPTGTGNAAPFIAAVVDIADSLPPKNIAFMRLSADIYARRALFRGLHGKQSDAAKKELIKEVFEQSEGLCATATIIRGLEERKEDSSLPKMTTEECQSLKQAWLTRVRAAARSGHLLQHRELRFVLWYWSQWSDSEELKKWVRGTLRDERSAVTFLRGMVMESTSQNIDSYHVDDRSFIDRTTLEQFSELTDWKELAARLEPKSEYTVEEQRAIRLFKRAMQTDSKSAG
jgi:predicted KAP-like P-loop ATPase